MLEPSVKMNTREGQRWIYTAITRSTDKVSVCFVGDLFDRVEE
jgi:IS1 family transposase